MSSPASEADLLQSFTEVLQGSAQITLPDETLYGAITHFLCSLSNDKLAYFATLVITSPSLWSAGDRARPVQEAVRLAVLGRVEALDKKYGKAVFPEYRRNKHAKQWISVTAQSVTKADMSVGRRAVLLGLVEGMQQAKIPWGRVQEVMEEELVIESSTLAESTDKGLDLLCETILLVAEERSWALDLPRILPRLQDRVTGAMARPSCGLSMVQALGRLYRILNKGEDPRRVQAWTGMEAFSVQDPLDTPKETSVFLTIARDIVDIIVDNPSPSMVSVSHDDVSQSVRIASGILKTLFISASSDRSSTVDDEVYSHVIFGCLDVLEAKEGQMEIGNLFRRMISPGIRIRPSQAAFAFVIGEQVVHLLEAGAVREMLLPLCQDYLRSPEHPASFEAAHEFIIALIKAFMRTPVPEDQTSFMTELIPAYARILLRLFKDGDITSDQLRAAYQTVADGAAHCDDDTLTACIRLLENTLSQVASDNSKIQTLRLVRVSIAPFIPLMDVQRYLDDLAWLILATETGSKDRRELMEAAFGMIVKDLPDNMKRIGMDWWLKWQVEFEEAKEKPEQRARL